MFNKKILKNFRLFINKTLKKTSKYSVEIILLTTALFIGAFTTYENIKLLKNNNTLATSNIINDSKTQIKTENLSENNNETLIKVDVSGAVENPGIYSASEGARLGEIIEKAGGLTYEADELFYGRNFNMAMVLNDQDKIYVPYKFEISLGTFIEESQRVLKYLHPIQYAQTPTPSLEQDAIKQSASYLISINNASLNELDTLDSVGPTTAQKIIDNRPYADILELIERKVVGQSTFDKIKNFITL